MGGIWIAPEPLSLSLPHLHVWLMLQKRCPFLWDPPQPLTQEPAFQFTTDQPSLRPHGTPLLPRLPPFRPAALHLPEPTAFPASQASPRHSRQYHSRMALAIFSVIRMQSPWNHSLQLSHPLHVMNRARGRDGRGTLHQGVPMPAWHQPARFSLARSLTS